MLDLENCLCHWLLIYYKHRSAEHIFPYSVENRPSFEDEGGLY
jgi:hypothetical protein